MASEVRIKIGELEIHCTGDGTEIEEQLERTLRVLRNHLPDKLFGPRANGAAEAPSVASLLQRSRARSYGDKALVVAYWLQEYGGRPRWRTGDMLEQLQAAGETTPSNMTDALNFKAKKGLFAVRDRLWELTEKGKGWCESLLDQEESAGG